MAVLEVPVVTGDSRIEHARIQSEFTRILKSDPHLKAFDINVRVSKSHVVLAGCVRSHHQKQVAQESIKVHASDLLLLIRNDIDVS